MFLLNYHNIFITINQYKIKIKKLFALRVVKIYIVQILCICWSIVNFHHLNGGKNALTSIITKIGICVLICFVLFLCVLFTLWYYQGNDQNNLLSRAIFCYYREIFGDEIDDNIDTKENRHLTKKHLFKKCRYKNHKCAICFSRSNKCNLLKLKDCKHIFHKKCIYQWINTQIAHKFPCPCCRKSYNVYSDCKKEMKKYFCDYFFD